MNLPRKGCPGTQHRLMTSATDFNHHLDCSLLSWHLVESKGTLSPGQMAGLYFGPANCLTFEQCSVMTEILSPRAKIFTSNETMKTVATSLCSEYRGSKVLIIQEILDSFRFLHESVLDSKKALELSSSCREGPGKKSKLQNQIASATESRPHTRSGSSQNHSSLVCNTDLQMVLPISALCLSVTGQLHCGSPMRHICGVTLRTGQSPDQACTDEDAAGCHLPHIKKHVLYVPHIREITWFSAFSV